MKVLFINKFLYPNGGSETYCFNLASYLVGKGHQVQFFGMEHDKNIVSNDLNLAVSNVEFKRITVNKIVYPLKIIYSVESRKKLRKLILHFQPDIIHLNNYNFQITPSILYEIKKFNIPVVMTLHDFQIVCPNHMMYLEHENRVCEECKDRKYSNCIKNKCIHNSKIKSILAFLEGVLYYKLGTYKKYIDYFISPSRFLRDKIVEFGEVDSRIKVLHNFINESEFKIANNKDNYVLYFGRLSVQKGIETLIKVCKELQNVNFVFAGSGELEEKLSTCKNIQFVGFKSGEDLKSLISNALFSIYPSEWYENCPMSVLESQMYGTPVIGANIGGIPELIDDKVDGLLFEPGNAEDLAEKIEFLYNNRDILEVYSKKCIEKVNRFSIDTYYENLMNIYKMAIEKHNKQE